MRNPYDELPYFDEAGNEYVQELNRQDAYVRRGGKLSAPQMIKYENRVSMLVERLILIRDAVLSDPEALADYMHSIEQTRRMGQLPRQVYLRFKEKITVTSEVWRGSERDRDRDRVIRGERRHEEVQLSDLSVDDLLERYSREQITADTLFQQFHKREKSGVRLQKVDPKIWSRYRTWVAEKRRARKMARTHER
ncbi:MAG TPA: hypothetical protein VFG11_00105 [Acidobacteriota bacterium]|nr:hypothetical protein [Acidobacteriota bacterium]